MAIPEFNLERRRGAKIWISRSYSDPAFVDALADPDALLKGANCLVVKDERKIKVARLTVSISGIPRSLYLKRYNTFSLHYALRSSVAGSGAFRSLRGAGILNRAGISTATPVAAVENRCCGLLYKCFFVSEEVVDGKTADAYWRENLQHLGGKEGLKRRHAFLRQLAGLFQALHSRQIYHGDLKDANIIVVPRGEEQAVRLFLLDLENVRQYRRLHDRRRVKNLVQLYRTLGQYVPAAGRLFFFKCYLGSSFLDRELKRRLIRRVLRFARQVEELKARRTVADRASSQAGHR